MKKSIKVEIAIGLICLIGMMVMLAVQGCMVIKTDHAFIYTFAKTIDTEMLALVADPNSTKIGSGQSKTKNDKIEAIIPTIGIIKTTGE